MAKKRILTAVQKAAKAQRAKRRRRAKGPVVSGRVHRLKGPKTRTSDFGAKVPIHTLSESKGTKKMKKQVKASHGNSKPKRRGKHNVITKPYKPSKRRKRKR